MVHDYTRKQGVVHTEIMLPQNAPLEYHDRATLWNAVEKIEKAKNSQLAREITLALPIELSHIQNINLVREYVKSNFTDKGMCADIAVHDKDGSNPHVHIMLTMRPLNIDAKTVKDVNENLNKIWDAKSHKEYMLDEHGERIRLASGEYKSRKVNAVDWNDKNNVLFYKGSYSNNDEMAVCSLMAKCRLQTKIISERMIAL